MNTITLIILSLTAFLIIIHGIDTETRQDKSQDEVVKRKARRKAEKMSKSLKLTMGPEQKALLMWVETLTDSDYNVDHWKETYRSSSASTWFHGYARKLSDIFKQAKAKVNFALVGKHIMRSVSPMYYLYSKLWIVVYAMILCSAVWSSLLSDGDLVFDM